VWPSQWGGDTTFVIVKGNSMLPNFHTGDIVVARAEDELEIGDVVVYAVPEGAGEGKLIMHRLVGVDPDGTLVIQGDNRDEPDQFDVTADDVVGVARIHLPKAGLLVRYMGTWWFIAATVSLFVFVQLWPEQDEDIAADAAAEDGGRALASSEPAAAVGAAAGDAAAIQEDPRASGSRVVVDGDAAIADLWGDLALDAAHRRCLELCTAGAHTFGTRLTVVFPHGMRGVEIGRVDSDVTVVADGRTVRELVRAAPRGVFDAVQAVVVTSDPHLIRDAHAAGAATISVQIWRDLIVG